MPFTPSDAVILFINNSCQTCRVFFWLEKISISKVHKHRNFRTLAFEKLLWDNIIKFFTKQKKNPLTSWGPCLHKDSGKKVPCVKKQTFLFTLCILQYISVQSLKSLLAVAPFQPDSRFESLQNYVEFPGWISKMKTSSECMLTEGPQSMGSLSCFEHQYQKQSSTEAQQYT